MRKFIAVLVIVVLLFSFVSPACAEDGVTNNAFRKLGRGTCNIGLGILEIPKGISDANEESGMFAAYTWGVFQGIFKTIVRMTVGVYEVATFPIPFPAGYEPILTDPEFFMDDDIMI